ncbi:MAG: GIY-YIG nuclease family protein, partial [Candidatus Micrarchaeota archaeon]
MIDWNAPDSPGVYIFKAGTGEIIYVGKAKSLPARLASYQGANLDGKTAQMMVAAQSLEVIACRNEAEALILENTLIKQHRPKYNISLKDSAQYAYLKITG